MAGLGTAKQVVNLPGPPASCHFCLSYHRACRLILFLQQSSVEWASSLWLNVVQEVDPTFQRTVGEEERSCALALFVQHL